MGAASESYVKRFLIRTALNSKGKEVDLGIKRRDSIWDYLVFRKVQDALGGRVRLVVSGSAPINAEILKFFRCALGCLVIEGYGQTESSGLLAMTLPSETTGGHIGPPPLATAMKLVDVPEMNYYAQNDQGELCVKGAMVFKGYYKNPEETQKALDEDGWLHTGDIATWLPNGVLKIIDRRKNIFKLSQGEYVAPEKIEIIYSRCPSVAQIFVYGDSLQSFLVGIVVPDAEVLKKLYPTTDVHILCADPSVKTLIMEELEKVGRENELKSFEKVKDIYLHPEPFSLEQGLLTPTMKSKRPELTAFFKSQIEQMYANYKGNGAN
jgi:long-chain acyl-CoA synthetase